MTSIRKVILHQTPKSQTKGNILEDQHLSVPQTSSVSKRSQVQRPNSNGSRHSNFLIKKAISQSKLFNVKPKLGNFQKENDQEITQSVFFESKKSEFPEKQSQVNFNLAASSIDPRPQVATSSSVTAPLVAPPEQYNCHSKNQKDVAYRNYLQMLYKRNINYLNHLKGDCICGQCICGHCRCPDYRQQLDQFSSTKTLYQQDFDPKAPGPSLKINPRMYQFHNSDIPMDGKSIQKSDYIPHKNNPYAIVKPQQVEKQALPFAGVSSYQESYLYWGTTPASLLKPPVYGTVVPNLKFHDQTTYKDSFQNNVPNVVFVKRPKGNIQHDLPFLSETTHHASFQPFKLGGKGENYKNKKVPDQTPAYNGQFNSEHQSQFDDKGSLQCPSREFLNQLYQSRVSDRYDASQLGQN